MKKYLENKPLSEEKTRALIKQHQEGSEDAMEQLVLGHFRLIWSTTSRFQHTGHDLEDLFQIACIGFIKCVNKFDINYTSKFSTYAVPLIWGEIYNFLRNEGAVKVPRNIQKIERMIVKNELQDKSAEEISEILGLNNIELIKDTLVHIKKGAVISLSAVVYNDGRGGTEITLGEQLSGDVNGDWLERLGLQEVVNTLDEREKQIVNMRFGQDMTQREVGQILGISQTHVYRLEKRAIDKVRQALGITTQQTPVDKPKDTAKTVGPKELRGNREQAIHLLQTSSLSLNDIAAMTGVPFGSLPRMAKKYRPVEITKSIMKRGRHKKGELNAYPG